MQEVRGGDAHRVHARVGGELPPVARGGGEAELRRGLLGAAGRLVGHRDELRRERQPREVVQDARVGLRVHPAHPAEAGHRDADRPAGARFTCPLMSRSSRRVAPDPPSLATGKYARAQDRGDRCTQHGGAASDPGAAV